MARAERRESERWPAAGQDDRWPEAGEEEQWAEPEPEERWQEPAPSRRRTGRLRVEIPPIVNPYAIVALVAALVGLFPVAIVFGFIAFSHPRGRVMAMFALLIGVAEVTAVAGLVVLSGNMLPDSLTRADRSVTTALLAPPTTANQLPQPTASAAPPVATTTASPSTSNQSNLKKGASCTDGQVGQIGSAADGGTLICLGSGSGYQWSGPYTVSTTVQQAGAKCDGTSTKTGRTADGRALVCEPATRSGTWVLWTE
ncbi:DUF4190 domain-containing protein [Nocardia sp. NBC_01499]|uniref:DUF4190 domain-containing protein n=1 Tax=Nocardia sp. NBC_01499 TaxID=2903597 RepID=UPI00386F6194